MECIVAIAVIALTGAMIGPPLVLAAATRLQNRRAEQALQIAQGEVDRIRTLVTLGEHDVGNLPFDVGLIDLGTYDAPRSSINMLDSVNAGCTTSTPYDGSQLPTDEALPIDIDGDCDTDFLMQVFRDAGQFSATNPDQPNTFEVMVRVYAANAATNYGTLGTEPASLRFTSGEGNQRQRPLAVLTSELNWSEQDGALFCYHDTDGDGDCEE